MARNTQDIDQTETGRSLAGPTLVMLPIVLICCGIELALQGADMGFWGPARLRALSYEYAAFWSPLLTHWPPNYPLQPYAMFFTYGFLHAGLLHLVLNMITLWSLSQLIVARVGALGFYLLYTASLLGGAAAYALLAANSVPMVGASGALFGLAGGILAWNYIDRFVGDRRLWPVAQAAILLLLMNVLMWWVMQGHLAWQTHLGGFVAGWVAALLIDPRPHKDVP